MTSSTESTNSPVAALIRARQTLDADPDNARAHFEHALVLCQLGQWEQAAAAWQDVLRLEPGNAFAHINLGVVYLEQARWAQAESAFRQAIDFQPDQPAAYYGLGAACARQNQWGEARSAWEQTLHLTPDHAEARCALDELNALTQAETLPPVEYVVTSQLYLQPPSVSNAGIAVPQSAPEIAPVMESAIAAETAPSPENALAARSTDRPANEAAERGVRPVPAPPAAQPIKLPAFQGPSLGSIADTVIAAQRAPRPDTTAEAAAGQAAGQEGGQDGVAKTLRLDAGELHNAHRNLRLRQSLNSVSGRALMGAGAVCALALLVWAGLRGRVQSETFEPNAIVTPAALPVTAAGTTTPPDAMSLSRAATPAAVSPSAVLPAPTSAPEITRTRAQDGTPRGQDRTAPQRIVTRSADDQDAPRTSRRRHALATDAAARPSGHAPVRRPEIARQTPGTHASRPDTAGLPQRRALIDRGEVTYSRRHRSDNEDTFSSRANPPHSAASEEWTDKLPE